MKPSLPARPHAAALGTVSGDRRSGQVPEAPGLGRDKSATPRPKYPYPLGAPAPETLAAQVPPSLASLSQAQGALKCSADSRAPGTWGPRPAQDRACRPGQHNPGRGWRRITADKTPQPYSPCRAGVGKEDREGLWEKESSLASTTSGLPGGGGRKRRCCDASSARRGEKGVKASGAGPQASRFPSQLPIVGFHLLRANEGGRGLRFAFKSSEKMGSWSPGGRGQGRQRRCLSVSPSRSVIQPALPELVSLVGSPEMTYAPPGLEGVESLSRRQRSASCRDAEG